jgi:hypothetical protein
MAMDNVVRLMSIPLHNIRFTSVTVAVEYDHSVWRTPLEIWRGVRYYKVTLDLYSPEHYGPTHKKSECIPKMSAEAVVVLGTWLQSLVFGNNGSYVFDDRTVQT